MLDVKRMKAPPKRRGLLKFGDVFFFEKWRIEKPQPGVGFAIQFGISWQPRVCLREGHCVRLLGGR